MSDRNPPKIDADEEWRSVPEYEGKYMVSSYGRVFALPRTVARKSHAGPFTVTGGIRKPYTYPEGTGDSYARISLYGNDNRKSFLTHVLVAAAFIGPRPKGKVVRHKDLDAKNCSLLNLEYGTQTQNNIDQRRSGKPHKKLLIEDAREIRFLKSEGFATKDLAEAYGVSGVAIGYIVRYKFLKEECDYV